MFDIRFSDYPSVMFGLRGRLRYLLAAVKVNSDYSEEYTSFLGFVDGLSACHVISSEERDFFQDLAFQVVYGRSLRIKHQLDRPF